MGTVQLVLGGFFICSPGVRSLQSERTLLAKQAITFRLVGNRPY